MENGRGGSQLVAVNKIDIKGNLPKAVTNAMALRSPIQWQQQFLKACHGLMASGCDLDSGELEIGLSKQGAQQIEFFPLMNLFSDYLELSLSAFDLLSFS